MHVGLLTLKAASHDNNYQNQPKINTGRITRASIFYIKTHSFEFPFKCSIGINSNGLWAGVSLRFGVGGHLDFGQSLCKALKNLKIFSYRDAESSRAKLSSQSFNLPSARLFMKPLYAARIDGSILQRLLLLRPVITFVVSTCVRL